MQASCHIDSNTEANPHIWILINIHFTMATATHLHLFHRIKSSTRQSLARELVRGLLAQVGERAEGRLCVRGLKMAMGHGENHQCAGGHCA
jgi:hypothetical protein